MQYIHLMQTNKIYRVENRVEKIKPGVLLSIGYV